MANSLVAIITTSARIVMFTVKMSFKKYLLNIFLINDISNCSHCVLTVTSQKENYCTPIIVSHVANFQYEMATYQYVYSNITYPNRL